MVNDGWDYDQDEDNDQENGNGIMNEPNGWEDDDIPLDDDDDFFMQTRGSNHTDHESKTGGPVAKTATKQSVVDSEQWDDWDDDHDDHDKQSPSNNVAWRGIENSIASIHEHAITGNTMPVLSTAGGTTSSTTRTGIASTIMGDWKGSSLPSRPPNQSPPRSGRFGVMEEEILSYLRQLDQLHTSVNAVLQYEYNTPEKAVELLQYYQERPNLQEYTIQKELGRLQYRVILERNHGGRMITDPKQIAACFVERNQSLLSRCANQSLLADLVHVITGPDLIVRPQWHAAATAKTCQFLIDYEQGYVHVQTTMIISLPTEDQQQHGRWNIAELSADVIFYPSSSPTSTSKAHPYVEYRILHLRTVAFTADISWRDHLDSTIRMLDSIRNDHDDAFHRSIDEDDNEYRDAFLIQSQSLLQHSARGMKLALQDIDAVVGIGQKLKQIPAFLPTDVIQAAAEQEMPHSPIKNRPTSILGGLVRTGWSKLAQTVKLPEEDPSMYRAYTQPPVQHPHDWQQQLVNPTPDWAPSPKGHIAEEALVPTRSSIGGPPPIAEPITRLVPQSTQIKMDEKERVGQRSTRLSPAVTTLSGHNIESSIPPGLSSRSANTVPTSDLSEKTGDVKISNSATATPSASVANTNNVTTRTGMIGVTTEPLKRIIQEPEWVYDPITDIIPTRKRWVNPRPTIKELGHI